MKPPSTICLLAFTIFGFIPTRYSSSIGAGFVPWDVVSLLSAFFPNQFFDHWQKHAVQVPACDGAEPCDGGMVVDPRTLPLDPTVDLPYDTGDSVDLEKGGLIHWKRHGEDHRNVVLVPHRLIDEESLIHTAIDLMCEVPAANEFPNADPRYLAGFLPSVVMYVVTFVLLGGSMGVALCALTRQYAATACMAGWTATRSLVQSVSRASPHAPDRFHGKFIASKRKFQ